MPKETAGDGGLGIKDIIMQLRRKAGIRGKRILTSLNPLTRCSNPLPISLWIITTSSARPHEGGELHSGFYDLKTTHPDPFREDTPPTPQKAQNTQWTASSYSLLFPGSLPTSQAFVVPGWLRHQLNQVGRDLYFQKLGMSQWLRGLAALRALEFRLKYPSSS